jgi:YebC/PmpR family DNA-binding regulatory protein
MSGHSKWANIRVKKTAEDAKRGKIFTKHARLIEIAARSGSPDPTTNASLRTAIENAREDNVPNANIERAIKKGSGDLKGEQMSEEVYAAYGPGGAAFLIECLTDNKNRTLSNVRNIATKNGGNFADSSSVVWMFDRKGVVTADIPAGKNIEEIELELIDFGAEDVNASGGSLSVTTAASDWAKVRDFLKNNGFTVSSAGLKFLPNQKTEVSDLETAKKVIAFMEAIEEDDDVSEVHTNADIPESIAAQL